MKKISDLIPFDPPIGFMVCFFSSINSCEWPSRKFNDPRYIRHSTTIPLSYDRSGLSVGRSVDWTEKLNLLIFFLFSGKCYYSNQILYFLCVCVWVCLDLKAIVNLKLKEFEKKRKLKNRKNKISTLWCDHYNKNSIKNQSIYTQTHSEWKTFYPAGRSFGRLQTKLLSSFGFGDFFLFSIRCPVFFLCVWLYINK